MAAQLEELAPISQLSPCVLRVLGGNPGTFTLQGTNTYIVGTGSSRVLIDTGEGKTSWAEAIASVIADGKFTISTVIATHHHHDHVGGFDQAQQLFGKVVFTKIPHPSSDKALPTIRPLTDQEVISCEGATLKVIATPGHTDDHLCLFLEEEQAIFTGDCILGQGTAVFENLRQYLLSLQRLLPFNPTVLYPGHGPVITNGAAKVHEYITHRNQREKQIVDYLTTFSGPQTIENIVAEIYKAYPKHLHKPAEGSVLLHLNKLKEEGKVVHDEHDATWQLVAPASL